jgi:hypothetical protein
MERGEKLGGREAAAALHGGARRSKRGGQPEQSGRRPAGGEPEGERVAQDKVATVSDQNVDSELWREFSKDFFAWVPSHHLFRDRGSTLFPFFPQNILNPYKKKTQKSNKMEKKDIKKYKV